jgi:branched-subunit amino acid aminotransferase/4-amino-4-deoxychorismate lyase
MAFINGVAASPDQLQALALVNYGHFTSIRVDGQRVKGLLHHLDRLARDCRQMFGTDLDHERVRTLIREAIVSDGSDSMVVRVTVFDPCLELGRPSDSGVPVVLVTTRHAGPAHPGPLRLQSAIYQRDLPHIKHVGLLGVMWHRRATQQNGYDDALFADASSFVSEGPTWNIAFHDGDRVIWPDAPILGGVTMRLLQQVHDHSVTMPVNLRDVPFMRAAFATNTTIGIRPITAIDGVSLPGDAEIFQLLRKSYEEIPAERI